IAAACSPRHSSCRCCRCCRCPSSIARSTAAGSRARSACRRSSACRGRCGRSRRASPWCSRLPAAWPRGAPARPPPSPRRVDPFEGPVIHWRPHAEHALTESGPMANTARKRARTRREPMSRVDTAWLRMERGTNPMMITGVLMFAEQMSLAALRQVIKQRFLAYKRFRQKPVDTQTGAYWQRDEHFDLDWHVQLAALPGKGDKRALERFVSQLASSPLDSGKPLWQFHLVERYSDDGRGTGSALIARIHHSYADGMALVQVLLSLTDTAPTPAKGSELSKAWLKEQAGPVARRVGAAERAMQIGGKLVEQGMAIYRDPSLGALLAKEGRHRARTAAGAGAARRSAVLAARRPRHDQARGLGRTARPRRSEGGRPRMRLHRQR